MTIVSVFLALLQSLLNRNRGWGDSPLPSILKRALCVLVPSGCLIYAGVELWICAISAVLGFFGILVAHGTYYTLGRGPYPDRDDNWCAWLPEKLGLPRVQLEWVALAITGLCATVPFAVHSWMSSLTLVIAGISKPICYKIALVRSNGQDHIREAEFLTGFVYGIAFSSPLWS